jgi:hypothetical protein
MTELPDDVSPEELAAALQLVKQRRASSASRTIFVRGEGGAVFEMDPDRMSKEVRRQMQLGRLRRVNPDGTPYRRPGAASPDPDPGTDSGNAGGSALTEGRTPRPAKNARKADWVLYAVAALGVDAEDAEGMSKGDLMELPDPPPDTPPAARPGKGGPPADDAPKSVWIDHIVSLGLLAREDAEAYTRDDLIAMVT